MGETLYDVLNVEESATTKEIKKSYFKLVRKFSPEKSPDKFKKIRKAY